ncbi:MAG: ATP-binding protein [Actinomycetota bacterium]
MVFKATAEAAWKELGPGQASVWLTTGIEAPRLAYLHGSDSVPGREVPPRSVTDAVKRQKFVVDADSRSVAIPILAPRSGPIGVLCFQGRICDLDELAFLNKIARECGYAIESANLYEKAIAEKEKSEAILAHVGDGVVVTDPKGKLLQVNEAATRILVRTPQEALGQPCSLVLGLRNGERKLDCSQGCALLEEINEAQSMLGIEVWRERITTGRQPLLANVSAVKDADGNVSEVVHSLRDITKLKEADEAKTLFLAIASHELKTPLTVIQGFSQLLSSSRELPEVDRQKGLEAMERRAIQLNKIVDRLLLSSRIESGRVEILSKDIDLTPIFEERVDALGSTSGRDVVLDVDPDMPLARADLDAVTTVVDHLLDNALKYSPDGGAITLRGSYDESWVYMSISDPGIGMDREQAARCFDKFWQAESTDVRRFGGTGIGLFIVRSLVEAMEGRVVVQSTPGAGSTFFASFPRVGQMPVEEEPVVESKRAVAADPSVIREFMHQIGIPKGRTK